LKFNYLGLYSRKKLLLHGGKLNCKFLSDKRVD